MLEKDTSTRLDYKTWVMLKEIAFKSGKTQIQLLREILSELYQLSAMFPDKYNLVFDTSAIGCEVCIKLRGSRVFRCGSVHVTPNMTQKDIDLKMKQDIEKALGTVNHDG